MKDVVWRRIRGEKGRLISGATAYSRRMVTLDGDLFVEAYYREGGPGDEKKIPRCLAGKGSTRDSAARSAREIISRYDPSPTIIQDADARV